ncbi:nicotinamide/nicotinic acid mononucleotide adenylyltransferase 1-like [Gigantopelta aegis]|uniref:nicotinamide/nicotinic acid mononucleotide adenylyltransferase 1-like n=1 Tax=Gigantopelta aegis TaxID=1735272 RepID=UPI001B8885AC|nr:nicotinamide/nicotinic acid mononucleotide adenylyltransferase 1-like [Gigantopelta aegis]
MHQSLRASRRRNEREMFPRPSSFAMASPAKVILLACGSFNPVTNMHLRMFELARDQLNKTGRYEVIGGIISPVSDGYRKEGLVTAKHRCAMLRLALKTSDWVRLDTWECELKEWSRTERVLSHHRKALLSHINDNIKPGPTKKRKNVHKSNGDESVNTTPKITVEDDAVQVKLLCGADLLESFAVPGLWLDEDIEEIVGSYGLVCISRSGTNAQKFIYESDVLTKFQSNIFVITEWIYNDISSTKIRRALRRQESVKYLIQDSVIEYVRKHQLYGVPDK